MVEEEKKTKPLGPVVWLLPLVVGLGLVGVYFGAFVPSDKTPNPTINPTVVESSEIVVAKPKEPELLMVEEVEQVVEKTKSSRLLNRVMQLRLSSSTPIRVSQ